MSERSDRDFLNDIHEAARRIAVYTTAMTYELFLADIKTQDAVIRNLDIVWHVVTAELPQTAVQIKEIIQDEQANGSPMTGES